MSSIEQAASGLSSRSQKTILMDLLVFLGLLALFSSVSYYFVIEHGLRRYYMGMLMWSPGLAALLTCKLRGISLLSLGWRWASTRWSLASYFIPAIYGLIAYGIIWGMGYGGLVDGRFVKEVAYFLGLSGWSETATIMFGILMFGTIGMTWHMATSLGEELGWRGFLTMQLMQRYSFPITAILTGLVWALWHAPIIFLTKYNAGPVGLEMQFFNFTLMCIGLSSIMTYLRLKTDSVWTSVIFHAAHNVYILTIMQPMTVQYKKTWQYANEFGYVLPIVALVFGVAFWWLAKRDNLDKVIPQNA